MSLTDEDKIWFIEMVGAALTKSCRLRRDPLDERIIIAVEAKVKELKARVLADPHRSGDEPEATDR